ncbi:FAD-dependent monooxygenase [Roseateles koreensis]|uniref:FAD-dependent monooxygenase n=1 Tax=Roseateles koreensis TaxID=2987526 RepID=A0ABT5KNW2_9BURK|nr:FAD-dependent monooxygenase [Roseateles koreensis]MDC8784531.1 FAD-dependent monooxygenase [Roseateles koreensis]
MNSALRPVAPVAIVGGGPVGLMLALLLDRHGVASVVFDSATGTRLHPKGSTHNTRTMEHYRRVGIADAVRKLGLPADHPRDVAYFTRLNGFELARFELPSEQRRMCMAQDAPATDQTPEPLLRANQMYVDRYMHGACARPCQHHPALRLAGDGV